MNAENTVLLQLRSKDDYLYPDCWTLPGGRVEEGESLEQAIVREVREELRWDLRGCSLFRTNVLNDSDGMMERHIYWGKISEKAEDLRLGEGAALRFFSSEEVSELEVAFDLKPVIIDFLKTKRASARCSRGGGWLLNQCPSVYYSVTVDVCIGIPRCFPASSKKQLVNDIVRFGVRKYKIVMKNRLRYPVSQALGHEWVKLHLPFFSPAWRRVSFLNMLFFGAVLLTAVLTSNLGRAHV